MKDLATFYSYEFVDCTALSIAGSQHWLREADQTRDAGPTFHAEWTAAPGRVEILQDRLGMIPLFWWSNSERFVASTSLLEVARRTGARDLDWNAIAAFMAVGNYVGEETPFIGIQTLPPGAKLSWTYGQPPEVKRRPLPVIAPFTGTREEARRIYAELFSKAVARRLPDDLSQVVVPLSGGRDSRHIALEIAAQQKLPVKLLTIRCEFGRIDEDVRVAALVADRMKSPHTVIDIDWSHYIEIERLKNFSTHFLVDIDHHSMFEMSASEKLENACVFFGMGGDVLIGDSYFRASTEALLNQGRFAEVADIELGSYQRPAWLRERGDEKLDRSRAKRNLTKFLESVPKSTNMFRDYVLLGRQVRNTALVPFDLLLQKNRVVTPYLDVDLLTFQRSLPADPFGPQGIHDEIIAESYPQYADIEYERKGLNQFPLSDRRWKAIKSVWRNLDFTSPRFTHNISKTFFWPRIVHASLGRGIEDMWWLRKMIYLLDLLEFSQNPDAVYATMEAHHSRLLKRTHQN